MIKLTGSFAVESLTPVVYMQYLTNTGICSANISLTSDWYGFLSFRRSRVTLLRLYIFVFVSGRLAALMIRMTPFFT